MTKPEQPQISSEVRSWELKIGDEKLNIHLEALTQSKTNDPGQNEDIYGYDEHTIVVVDGSTPKRANLKKIGGQSEGRTAADLVSRGILDTNLNGAALVKHLTLLMQDYYRQHKPEALHNPIQCFAASFVAARITIEDGKPMLVITQVGDSGVRINGNEVVYQERLIDKIDAKKRAEAIKEYLAEGKELEQALELGRAAILESLNAQYLLWNNPQHPHGFGYINGLPVPEKFIEVRKLPLSEVNSIELFTDGYPVIPDEVSVTAWEAAYSQVEQTDPYRYHTYLATKPKDDRTIVLARFDSRHPAKRAG